MTTTKPKQPATKVDKLMDDASAALVKTRYFESERASLQALDLALASQDYERMGRIVMPLLEARRQKRLQAVDSGKVFRLGEPLPEKGKVKAGCYLVEPPLVGADGRDLRDRANAEEVPVFVVVREPETGVKQWPIVMIGPVTIRVKLAPPKKVTAEWLLGAGEALGDELLRTMDEELTPPERVTALIDRLMTLPEHEKLHQALETACRDAAAWAREEALRPKPVQKRKIEDEESDDDFDAD